MTGPLPDAPDQSSRSGAQDAPGRVLVVDDLEVNRGLLRRRASRLGYQVDEAASGEAAMRCLGNDDYDVVLLDVMMPGMDGYEVLERIKADPALGATRVIMVSAVEEIESVVRCIALGADDYLPKPFNPVLLEARLASSLARKQVDDARRSHAAAMERELQAGREIQSGFFPTRLPQPEGWTVHAHFESARQVAGDFYDAFELADGALGLVVGDVCDKGLGAALYMALFRSLLRSRALEVAGPPDAVLRRALSATNDYIAGTHDAANMFATVFFAVLEPGPGVLHYVSAGHDPPVLLEGDGGAELLRDSTKGTGPALGLWPGATFTVGQRTLRPGAALLVYTDGVTEAGSPTGEFFGEQRLLRVLAGRGATRSGALDDLADALSSHRAGEPVSDDVTMLLLTRAPQ